MLKQNFKKDFALSFFYFSLKVKLWGQMGADGHFRVTLSLRREPAAGPVYCKMETSARFRQLKTVKLSCEATYRLDISFKPPQLLEWVQRIQQLMIHLPFVFLQSKFFITLCSIILFSSISVMLLLFYPIENNSFYNINILFSGNFIVTILI